MSALRHHRRNWTPATDAYLVRRRGRGASAKVIAREIGRTPRAVEQRLWRLEHELAGDVLTRHRAEELALLARLEAEMSLPPPEAR